MHSDEVWVLGHVVDRAMGGDDSQLAFEHLHCSRKSGAALSAMLTRARRNPYVRTTGTDLFAEPIDGGR